ncbi:MAG: threonine ammonia-lyase [Rhodospirillaceae bacterium]|nr:threonine ammonia-lyase [Rhodospirillaceae bacterium]
MSVSVEDIRAAADAIAGEVVRTPTVRSGPLSDLLGLEVFVKLETLQRTGSFKDRGALFKLKSLSPDEMSRGVIAISAGNHAQGVAYHAQRLAIPATIVMPEGTPFNKVRRTQAFGAKVVLHGDNISAAEPFAHALAEEERLTFVHPYDDERIIAGQGTIGLEMLEDVPDLDTIIVPIGGGGIISGIATAAKSVKPAIEIIGVESEFFPTMFNAVRNEALPVGGDSIAEGIAVKSAGMITREIIARLADDMLVVSESAIESAVQTMLIDAKIHTEGAGASPLAALRENPDRFAAKKVGLVACGGNIDSRLLASVLMRGMSREGYLARLRVTISDQPGVLGKVAEKIGESGGNIVEIYHHRLFYDVPLKLAELDVVVETRDAAHSQEIIERLEAIGFPTRKLDDVTH